jgi:hypothetical protein
LNEFKIFNRIKLEFKYFNDSEILIKNNDIYKSLKSFGSFTNLPNLKIFKYLKKNGISGEESQILLDDMKNIYNCKIDFQKFKKMKKNCDDIKGPELQLFKCKENHNIKLMNILEFLKLKFGEDIFLKCFHVKTDNSNSNNFFNSESFLKIVEEVEKTGHHPLILSGFRDSFPGHSSTNFPIKGFYYQIMNLSYPEIIRNLGVFGLVQSNCKSCCEIIETHWINQINELSKGFSIYHKFLGKFVKFKLYYFIEMEDSPERAKSIMSMDSNSKKPCSQCKIDSDRLDDAFYNEEVVVEEKNLVESKKLYIETKNLYDLNIRGNKTIVRNVEKNNGYKFTQLIYNENLKSNNLEYKKPTSFFSLDEINLKNLKIPIEPFHALVKNYLTNIICFVWEGCTEEEKILMDKKYKSIFYPKNSKKTNSLGNFIFNFF